jgi:WD40 repeat protein
VAYSADSRLLAVASTAGLALYDASSLEAVRALPGGECDQLAFAAQGHAMLARCPGYSATVWNVDSGRVIREFPAPKGTIVTYALSPAGDLAAAALPDGGVRLRRVADGELLYSQRPIDDHALSALAFSADGTLLAIGLDDGTIRLIRVPEGTVVREIIDDQYSGGDLCFSPDGALLASCTDNGLHLWRVADGCLLDNADEIRGRTSGASFSPDGALLAWAESGKVCVGRARDGQVLYTLEESSAWGDPLFSPDGRVLATFCEGIRLWDAADGRLLATLTRHRDYARDAVFSPDGRSLASQSDGVVRLWAVR